MSFVNRNAKLTKVGFWENPSRTDAGIREVHDAFGFMNPVEVRAVLRYIKASKEGRAMKGTACCRACDERLGSCDMYTPDERFVFPQRYEHYVITHNVRPPEEFVVAAMKWDQNES